MRMLVPALLALAFGAFPLDGHARDDDRGRYRDGDRHGRHEYRDERSDRRYPDTRPDHARRGTAQAFTGFEGTQRYHDGRHRDGWRDRRSDDRYRSQYRHDDRGDGRHRERYRNDDKHYGWNGDGRGYGYGNRNEGWRRDWHHGWSGTRHRAPARYYYPRGYGYRAWEVGYYLPRPFLSSGYYIDYRPYGIAPPPYGYRWVRVDGDLLLVEIASALIADILHGFYR